MDLGNRIANGVKSKPYAWPWAAILGFKSSGTAGIIVHCGGTLINENYVLTAAVSFLLTCRKKHIVCCSPTEPGLFPGNPLLSSVYGSF